MQGTGQTPRLWIGRPLASLSAWLFFAACAHGTTIEPMPLTTAADHAVRVISGRILQTQSRWATNPRRIETVVTLTQVEVLKAPANGGPAADSLEIVLPGGKIGHVEMRIAGAPKLHPGDRWILFLMESYRIHPIVGITQGAFRIVEVGGGQTRVLDASGHPVKAIRQDGTVELMTEAQPELRERLRIMDRVRLVEPPMAAARGMTVEEFKAALQPLLDDSTAHDIVRPARDPDADTFTATTLKASSRQQNRKAGLETKSRRSGEAADEVRSSRSRRNR